MLERPTCGIPKTAQLQWLGLCLPAHDVSDETLTTRNQHRAQTLVRQAGRHEAL
jgi:hypothetical protein